MQSHINLTSFFSLLVSYSITSVFRGSAIVLLDVVTKSMMLSVELVFLDMDFSCRCPFLLRTWWAPAVLARAELATEEAELDTITPDVLSTASGSNKTSCPGDETEELVLEWPPKTWRKFSLKE